MQIWNHKDQRGLAPCAMSLANSGAGQTHRLYTSPHPPVARLTVAQTGLPKKSVRCTYGGASGNLARCGHRDIQAPRWKFSARHFTFSLMYAILLSVPISYPVN